MMISNPLTWILLCPTISLILIFVFSNEETGLIRKIAKLGILASSLLSLYVFASYNHAAGGFQFVQQIPWVTQFGISYHVGVDGINSVLVLLLGLASIAAVLISDTVKERIKEYYILLLAVVIGTYGAFISLDIFFFYFFHEVAAIPSFLLIAIWGSGVKDYAAMKLTLYLTAGAGVALVGLIALYHAVGINSFDLIAIQQHLAANPIPIDVQNWIFPLIVLGFGVTLTLWPFYTWAPVGYASAPTAVSMLHAGVLKKLGAYAILRFAVQLMPEAAHHWMPVIATLAIVNILYCGFVALTHRDMKYIVSYSSCSHMGYILLGLACVDVIGVSGVVFLMFAHGVMAALTFALIGFYENQTNTRNLDELGGLAKRMPFIATCFMMAAFASAGVPGFANFVAEIMVLLGAWDQYRWHAVLAILGIVITAIYMLKIIRMGFQGPLNPKWNNVTDAVTISQKLPFIILLGALIVVGCFPTLILKNIESATQTIAERIK
jgi:NADH-quinone oxidoreductase subunit M